MATNGVADSSTEILSTLVQDLSESTKSYTGTHDVRTKNEIRAKARAIMAATQDPDTQWEDYFITMAELGCIREFVHIKAFDKIPMTGSISYTDLAKQLGAEVNLIARMGNFLSAMHILELDGPDSVKHTPRSQIYVANRPTGLIVSVLCDEMNVPCSKWPEYFDKHGLKEPGNDAQLCPHSFGWGKPEKNFWQVISDDPRRANDFNLGMSLLEHVQPCLGMYDFSWIGEFAQSNPDKGRHLIVDCGGGRGTTLQLIIGETPTITPSRCVLAERPDVLEQVIGLNEDIIKDVEKVPTNFFEDIPVKGALVYYIRRCLHDWSDENCVKILANMRKACAPDSRVLITEQIVVIPPLAVQVAMDICMLNLGGKERTEQTWRDITSQAGLEVINMWPSKATPHHVIECIPKAA